jgi:capsid portal protein
MKSTIVELKKARSTTETTATASTSAGSYKMPEHDIEDSLKLVMDSDYAKACVDDLVMLTVGKGLEKIPAEIANLLELELLDRVTKDYEKCANGYFEVKTLNRKVTELYHIPAKTVQVKEVIKGHKNVKAGLSYDYKVFIQNRNMDVTYKEFTAYTLRDDSMPDGSYILHLMNYEDDSFYGTPAWLPVMQKLKTSTAADIHNAKFFEGGCKLEGVLWTKGEMMDEDTAANVDTLMKRTTNIDGGHKILKIEMEDKDSEIGFLALNAKTDGTHLQLMKEYRMAICAAFKVPPKKIGIETNGQLGSGEYQEVLNAYYEDVIIPRQVFWESRFKWMFPEAEIQLKRPVIRSTASAGPGDFTDLTKGKKANNTIQTLLALRNELLED